MHAYSYEGNHVYVYMYIYTNIYVNIQEEAMQGHVHAFERDPKREEMLRKQMRKFGCLERVTTHLGDFMTAAACVDVDRVSHVLVDPSCSGSGIISQVCCRI
jgi:16S rRNA C967 or C1407 C5-methylase (RsmB/RsmF family)